MGGTSRISREAYVRFCERLGVRFPGPTRLDSFNRGYGFGRFANVASEDCQVDLAGIVRLT